MTEFGAAATLEIAEVTGAQAAIEQEVTVPVDMQAGQSPSQRSRSSGGLGGMGGASVPSLLKEQTETLVEILDTLEGGSGSGLPGGGGGGGGGIFPTAGAGAAGSGAAGLLGGGLGIAAGVVGATAAVGGASRFALGQGMLGQEGINTLQGRKQFSGLSGAGNALSNPLGAAGSGALNVFDPTGLGETAVRKATPDAVGNTAGAFATNQQRAAGALASGNLGSFEAQRPEWVDDLTSYSFPDPFEGVSWPSAPNPFEGAQWPDTPNLSEVVEWPDVPEPGQNWSWPTIPTPDQSDLPTLPVPDASDLPTLDVDIPDNLSLSNNPATNTAEEATDRGSSVLDRDGDGNVDVDDVGTAFRNTFGGG